MTDVVALAAELLTIQSPTGGEGKAVDFVSRWLVARGWNVTVQEVTPGRGNVWASRAGGGVTLSTHLDTVPPYIPPTLDGGRLYGRGACDAKGIAAAMMAAADRLAAAGEDRVDLLLVVGEEKGSDGARAANHLPATSRFLVNGEPTESRLASGAKGSLRVTVQTHGREAHSAYPHLGRSAIEPMLALLPTVRALPLPNDAVLGETTVNIGTIRGGTEANIIPGECEAELMFRLVGDPEPVRAMLERWAAGSAELVWGSFIPTQRFHTIDGFAVEPVAYTSDIPLLGRWGTPLLFGPGSIHVAHTLGEYIDVPELRASVDAYERIARSPSRHLMPDVRAFEPRERIPVAILGATGAVGQTFIRCLADHPWFEIAELAASERSAGKRYRDATHWLEGTLPARIGELTVLPCDPGAVTAPIVFSALDSNIAGEAEPAFARAGRLVLSNAKNFRMERDVPLVIPEVNASHLAVLEQQRLGRCWSGGIVTNANCAATVATLAVAPLHEAFGVRQLFVTTMQAISGAGYPGVPSLDILGNVIPFIGEEELKIEREMPKMLGTWRNGAIEPATFGVSAQANRVPVEHGHTVCVTVEFESRPSVANARRAFEAWQGDSLARDLPSSPDLPIVVTDAADRPQPRRDVNAGRGMTVVVGRLRDDPLLHLRLVALGHNTIRGAAGGSVLNAEVLVASGALDVR